MADEKKKGPDQVEAPPMDVLLAAYNVSLEYCEVRNPDPRKTPITAERFHKWLLQKADKRKAHVEKRLKRREELKGEKPKLTKGTKAEALAFAAAADDGDALVWGTRGDDSLVWGTRLQFEAFVTASDGDTFVWGT